MSFLLHCAPHTLSYLRRKFAKKHARIQCRLESAKYCKGETKDKSILQETSTNLAKMLHKIIPLICHATGGNHRVSKDIRGNQTTKIIRYLQDTHY